MLDHAVGQVQVHNFGRAVWEDAVSVNLNVSKLTLFTTPPPTSGPVLAGILGIMDRFLPDFGHPGDMVNYQRFIEACKYGFAKRTLIGDWRTQEEKKEEDAIRQVQVTLQGS